MKEWQGMSGVTIIVGVAVAALAYFLMPFLQEDANGTNMASRINCGLIIVGGIGLSVAGAIATYRSFWRERVQLLEEYLLQVQTMNLREAIEALAVVGICFSARPSFSVRSRARKLFWRQRVKVIADALGTLVTGALELEPRLQERTNVMTETAEILVDQYFLKGEYWKDEEEWPVALKELLESIGARHPAYVPDLTAAIRAVYHRREYRKEETRQQKIAERVKQITR